MEFIITDKAKGSREEVKGVTKDEVSEIQLEELEVSQTPGVEGVDTMLEIQLEELEVSHTLGVEGVDTTLLSTHRRKAKKEN